MQTTLAHGICGHCGAPIQFLNVSLCDRCLAVRLGHTAPVPEPAPATPSSEPQPPVALRPLRDRPAWMLA
jgi:hypothetical protein